VLDVSRPLDEADFDLLRETSELPRIVVANKSDLSHAWSPSDLALPSQVVSAATGTGLDLLRREVRAVIEGGNASLVKDTAAVTNVRHTALLERARSSLRNALDALEAPGGPVAEEFVLTDLHDARAAFEEVTGKRTSEDLLRHIFSRFCIGK
jgi:tRNA modification GTPase